MKIFIRALIIVAIIAAMIYNPVFKLFLPAIFILVVRIIENVLPRLLRKVEVGRVEKLYHVINRDIEYFIAKVDGKYCVVETYDYDYYINHCVNIDIKNKYIKMGYSTIIIAIQLVLTYLITMFLVDIEPLMKLLLLIVYISWILLSNSPFFTYGFFLPNNQYFYTCIPVVREYYSLAFIGRTKYTMLSESNNPKLIKDLAQKLNEIDYSKSNYLFYAKKSMGPYKEVEEEFKLIGDDYE